MIHNFNDDGFDSLYPKYAGGRPPTFTLPQRREIKKIALSRPPDHDLPFSTWCLSKLAEFLVAEGVVDDISHEGLRVLLREEGVSFQGMKTWKESNDPDFEAKKNRILELYERWTAPSTCPDRRPDGGDLHGRVRAAQPATPPRQAVGRSLAVAARRAAARGGGRPTPARTGCGTCWPATTCRPTGSTGTSRRARAAPSSWRSALPALAAPARGADRDRAGQLLSPHLSTKTDQRVGDWAAANNVELAYTPSYAVVAEPDRGPVPRAALLRPRRHRPRQSHAEQASMIRRYIAWRNRNAHDQATP